MTILSHKNKLLIIRYLIASVGLLFVALGVALSIMSNLGTSPLSCPSYVMEGIWGLTVGNWTIVINMFYLLIQVAILRKKFKAQYLMQIVATVIFGYMIDLSMICLQWLHPITIFSRVILILLSCVITAMGTSIEVIARAWMLSAEMTVFAISETIHKKFNYIKIAMDSSLVVISALLAYFMYGNPFGFGPYDGIFNILLGWTPGIVIGLGTLIMAFLIGWLMKFTDPIADKIMDKIIDRIIYSN